MNKRLKILVTNDDGVCAEGISKLAAAASQLGDVWVVAPEKQCSGMSQRVTIAEKLIVKPVNFPIDVRGAYSVSGTPADCVSAALTLLGELRPDFVFSGINEGCNAGFDIANSGTIGAAMEAVQSGIPAIAFSVYEKGGWELVDEHLLPITRELMAQPQEAGIVWNVNFPAVPAGELKGVLRERRIAPVHLYRTVFDREALPDGTEELKLKLAMAGPDDVEEGTDIHALLHGYISVGRVKCAVM